ncbi:unnamed protein product [Periconia digitata]|uniref:NADAR domain-containing protein n=1 Tax=Periconia digitata TaxID=1303443 RepID=A0A9W4UNL1_9PLEO|nr:unnamed protein product [Periconia digitata]
MPRPSKHPSNTNTNAASSSSSRSQKPVFFHGPHRGNGYLSQWYWAPFIVDGIRYETAEKWMMLHKARTFHDEAAERAILASTDPKEAKELGRLVEGFDERVWDGGELSFSSPFSFTILFLLVLFAFCVIGSFRSSVFLRLMGKCLLI